MVRGFESNARWLLAVLLVAPSVAGCGTSPVRQFYQDLSTAQNMLCDCWMQLGYADRGACERDIDPIVATEEELACIDRAYADHQATAEPAVSCVQRASSSLVSCISSAACVPTSLQACAQTFSTSADACPDLPASAQVAFGACTGGGPEGLTYDGCVDSGDCVDANDQCFAVTIPAAPTSGNFCSRTCASDGDCPGAAGFDGVCYDVESAGFLCYQQCDVDEDCALSSLCIELTLPGDVIDFVCAPNG